MNTLFRKTAVVLVCVLVSGCAMLSHEEYQKRKYELHRSQFQPYRDRDTIEAYEEFIATYPENMFISTAQLLIANLEFAPYVARDTIDGYMEFKVRYPDNQHVGEANLKIEQIEIKRYEQEDSIEGYREFLQKYPESNFALLAKQRLQELEFKEHDALFQKRFGLDLLLYRLHLKRLKKKLAAGPAAGLAAFELFVTVSGDKDTPWVQTHFLYAQDPCRPGTENPERAQEVYARLIAPSLQYLTRKCAGKKAVAGFRFDVGVSKDRFYGDSQVLMRFSVPREAAPACVQQAESGTHGVPAAVAVMFPEKTAEPGAEQVAQEPSPAPEPLPVDGQGVMKRVYGRDRGADYIAYQAWTQSSNGQETLSATMIEKRKYCPEGSACVDMSIVRYITTVSQYNLCQIQAEAVLTHRFAHTGNRYWVALRRADPTLTTTPDRFRHTVQYDFSLDVWLPSCQSAETHTLTGRETYRDTACLVVNSVPRVKKLPWGERTTWIDTSRWVPLKIQYADRDGNPWKRLDISWQQVQGRWYWKDARVENLQTGMTTAIDTRELRVNTGLADRDFTPLALSIVRNR